MEATVIAHAFGVCFAVLVTGLRPISDLIMSMIIAAVTVVFVAVVLVVREVVRLDPCAKP